MARRRRTGTTRQRDDCLAAVRSVSGLKIFCAVSLIMAVVAIFGGSEELLGAQFESWFTLFSSWRGFMGF